MTFHLKIELPFKGFNSLKRNDPEYQNVVKLLHVNLTQYNVWYPSPTQIPIVNALVFKRTEDGRLTKTISQVYPALEIEFLINADADLNEEYKKFSSIILRLNDELNSDI